MTKSTLDEMRLIEEEVEQISHSNDEKIFASKEQFDLKLKTVQQEYIQETELLIKLKEKQYEEERQALEAGINQKIDQNQSKISEALSHQKDELMQSIVKEVVNKYGN